MTNETLGKELKMISGERISTKQEFMEYIVDYYMNHEEYLIDVDTDYFDAIEQAYVDPNQGWNEYNNVWNNKVK